MSQIRLTVVEKTTTTLFASDKKESDQLMARFEW
jgi:hypothetical protein